MYSTFFKKILEKIIKGIVGMEQGGIQSPKIRTLSN